MTLTRRSWISVAVAASAMAWCLFVVVLHVFAGALTCDEDTSYCAMSSHKDAIYRGVLRDPGGRVLANTPFTVTFESRRQAGAADAGGFTTDSNGNYCIRWADERIVPVVNVESHEVGEARAEQPLRGANPPLGCQSGNKGIPWNRANGLTTTPEFRSVELIAAASLGCLFLGLLLGGPAVSRGVRSAASKLRLAGIALTTATTGLAFFVWFLLPPLQ